MSGCSDLKEDIQEIKSDMKDVKKDLSAHMARTAASEARIEIMEAFVQQSMETQKQNFTQLITIQENNQKSMLSQLKISIGFISGIVSLISAFALWFAQR